MKLEGSEEINDAIYCALNHIKLLRICETTFTVKGEETTSHGLSWNNAPVSPLVLVFCLFFFLLFFQRFGIFYSQFYHVTQINKSFRKNTWSR